MSLRKQREKRTDQQETHDQKLDQELDFFSIKLIKWVGVAGAILGIAILIAFWFWIFRLIYEWASVFNSARSNRYPSGAVGSPIG